MSADLIVILSFLALVLGIIGSVLPAVPGPVLSLAGVYLYWWGANFTEPSLTLLIAINLLVLLAVLADWFGPAIASRLGGASTRTALIAALVGVAGLLLAGPLGLILSAFVTAFALEYYRHSNLKQSGQAALASLLGVLGAPVIQLLVTLSILVSMGFVWIL